MKNALWYTVIKALALLHASAQKHTSMLICPALEPISVQKQNQAQGHNFWYSATQPRNDMKYPTARNMVTNLMTRNAKKNLYQASTSKPSSENSVATTVLRENWRPASALMAFCADSMSWYLM
jgi:hypothetical protein